MEINMATDESLSMQPSTSKCDSVLDVDSAVNGRYAGGDTDIAINGVVARVHVDQFDFNDFFANKAKYLQSKEIKNGGRKRKLHETKQEELSQETNSSFENKIKKRGRPKKLKQINLDDSETSNEFYAESTPPREGKQRGRPRKLITSEEIDKTGGKSKIESESKQLSGLSLKPVEKQRRFNGGDGSDVHISTSRIIKPNSRLQDFVVSSNVRYYARSPANKPIKEEPTTPKEKAPKKTDKNMDSDPLNISSTGDDDVRSFLPIFDDGSPCDDSQHSDESDTAEEPSKPDNRLTEKENQVDNLQPKPSKDTPKPKSFKADGCDHSPSKSHSRSDSKSIISIAKHPKNAVKNSTSAAQQKRLTQSPAVNFGTFVEKGLHTANDFANSLVKRNAVATEVAPGKSKVEAKVNGSNSTLKRNKTDVKYVLVDSDDARNRNKAPKVGDVDFNKLVRSLKLVKLPGANWKIRIVVSKQQTITEVTFTNKEVNERCIKFSRTITGYVITFGKSVVKLLGAPTKISSFNDVSVLLDIVHNISPNDPVLEYSTSSTV